MPLTLTIQRKEAQHTAVWEITETEKELLQKVELREEEKKVFNSFRVEHRKKEWLAVRALLKELRPDNPEIGYHENGRPYLKNNPEHISISHSGTFIAISLGTSHTPGVDIEQVHPRIHKIAPRFVSDKESSFLKEAYLTEQLCIIWAAKEVLYKIHPDGMLSFKENLLVEPFLLSSEGELAAHIITPVKTTFHSLIYKWLNNYILVFNSGN